MKIRCVLLAALVACSDPVAPAVTCTERLLFTQSKNLVLGGGFRIWPDSAKVSFYLVECSDGTQKLDLR